MARTKASVGSKVSSGKSTKARAVAAPPPPSSPAVGGGNVNSSSRNSYTGGNSVCPRETPGWQKPITRFFGMTSPTKTDQNGEGAGSSKEVTKKKRTNIIESDDENENKKTESSSKNNLSTTLNNTLELEPLNGEDSHKIAEYFPPKSEENSVSKAKKSKGGKGVKKSKILEEKSVENDKENVLNNSLTKSDEVKGKRAIEETVIEKDDLEISSNKRIKV